MFQRADEAVNPVKLATETISRIGAQTDSAILFYSCGKDSILLADMMAPYFKNIIALHMFFVKGLPHIEKNLSWLEQKYKNIKVEQCPHFMMSSISKNGIFCKAKPQTKTVSLMDVDAWARQTFGIDWSFYGNKKGDGLNRRLMLMSYGKWPVNEKTQKAYPLSDLKDAEVLRMIKQRRLMQPAVYGQGRSSGISFDENVFLWMRKNDPVGLEMIYKKFPLSKQILFEHDNKISEIQDSNDT